MTPTSAVTEAAEFSDRGSPVIDFMFFSVLSKADSCAIAGATHTANPAAVSVAVAIQSRRVRADVLGILFIGNYR